MLISPIYNTTAKELNKLVYDGGYKYLSSANYKGYDTIVINDYECNKIQRISIDDNKNILGYFSAHIDSGQRKFTSTYFVKFTYMYNTYASKMIKRDDYGIALPNFDEEFIKNTDRLTQIAKQDFKEFEQLIFNHPIHKGVELFSIAENPANAIYEKWLEKYDGERLLMKDYTMIPDGKLYDAYTYWFNCGRGE